MIGKMGLEEAGCRSTIAPKPTGSDYKQCELHNIDVEPCQGNISVIDNVDVHGTPNNNNPPPHLPRAEVADLSLWDVESLLRANGLSQEVLG